MANTYVSGTKVVDLWNEQEGAFRGSHERISMCRKLLAGKVRPPLPEDFWPGDPARESFQVSIPKMFTLALFTLNRMLQRRPVIKRYPIGTGGVSQRAMSVATKIEVFGNAGMEDPHGGFPYDAATDLLLNEGECLGMVRPALADWDGAPSLYERDEDGNDRVGEDGARVIRSEYRTDKSGRAEGESHYSGLDRSESTDYFKSERERWLTERPPWRQEAISRLHMLPLNPRITSDGVALDGALIKREFRASELYQMGFRGKGWEMLGEGMLAEAGQPYTGEITFGGRTATSSVNPNLTLYEAWLMGEDGPYCSYCVDGKPVRLDHERATDEEQDYGVVDLAQHYGLTRLPLTYAYGLSFPGVSDPDNRGVPFMDPYARGFLNLATLLTATVVHAWETGFGGGYYKPDAGLIQALVETNKPPVITRKSMTIQPILGDIQQPMTPEVGAGIDKVIATLEMHLATDTPETPGVGGERGSDSGYGQVVEELQSLGVLTQVQKGQKALVRGNCSHMLELSDGIAKRRHPVMLRANSPVPVEQAGEVSATTSVIELPANICGNTYDVTAEFPPKRGENLPLRAQNLELVGRGLMTDRQFLEADGDPAPEQTLAELEAQQIAKSPFGVTRRLELAARISGDEELQKIIDQQKKGLMTKPTDPAKSIPTDALAGLVGPQMVPPMGQEGITAPQMQDPGAAALGGIVQGPATGEQMTAQGLAERDAAIGMVGGV